MELILSNVFPSLSFKIISELITSSDATLSIIYPIIPLPEKSIKSQAATQAEISKPDVNANAVVSQSA